MKPVQSPNLNGKEILLAALRHEAVDRVPWVPYAGVHAGKLKGYTAQEVLTEGEKLLESLLAVNEIYGPDGQPIVFDLQVEAEILGSSLYWAEFSPPSVVTHPFSVGNEIPTRMPGRAEGRLPVILSAMREMKKRVGETTALYGLVTGPLTLASHLRGTEIFMDMLLAPGYVQQLVDYSAEVAIRVAEYYIDAGMDVVALVDPLVSQISPKHFRQFMLEPCQKVFACLRQQDVLTSFFVCGDATKNIEIMCQTAPDCIAVDENLDMVATKQVTDRYNITLSGNIPLTTKMLFGTQQDNMKFVIDLLDAVSPHNFILAPGCDMPYDTPIENVVGCLQAVRNPGETRFILENYEAPQIDLESVVIPDYSRLEKPRIEVFTLDSTTCAACTYMLRAVQRAVVEFADQVDLVEYRFTEAESVARVMKMGIRNLPSLYINGSLIYSSIIPSHQELVETIRKVLP